MQSLQLVAKRVSVADSVKTTAEGRHELLEVQVAYEELLAAEQHGSSCFRSL